MPRGHKGQAERSMSVERRPTSTEPRTAEEREIRENELKRRGRWLNPETKAMIAKGRRDRAAQAREARQQRRTSETVQEGPTDDHYREVYRRMTQEGDATE